jgi:hypothetical protein
MQVLAYDLKKDIHSFCEEFNTNSILIQCWNFK